MSKKNIAVTAGMISLLTMISKCIGFVREMVMAGCYGTSRISDIYVLSNTIPTGVLESLFLAVATAYMPLLAENDRKGNAESFTVYLYYRFSSRTCGGDNLSWCRLFQSTQGKSDQRNFTECFILWNCPYELSTVLLCFFPWNRLWLSDLHFRNSGRITGQGLNTCLNARCYNNGIQLTVL